VIMPVCNAEEIIPVCNAQEIMPHDSNNIETIKAKAKKNQR